MLLMLVCLWVWIFVASSWSLKDARAKREIVMSSSSPKPDSARYMRDLSSSLSLLGTLAGGMMLTSPRTVVAFDDEDIEIYVDQKNGFELGLYPGWKQKRTISPTRYKDTDPYEVVYVASNLAEGCSLLVNNIDARALLKDASIEWWFGDLNTLRELGTPPLLADLLIKQRKAKLMTDSNPYEGPKSEEEKKFNDYQGGMDEGYTVTDSSFNNKEQSLQFTYTSSIGKYINEVGFVKGFYTKEKLKLVWISALGSVFESDYGDVLKAIRGSFKLVT